MNRHQRRQAARLHRKRLSEVRNEMVGGLVSTQIIRCEAAPFLFEMSLQGSGNVARGIVMVADWLRQPKHETPACVSCGKDLDWGSLPRLLMRRVDSANISSDVGRS